MTPDRGVSGSGLYGLGGDDLFNTKLEYDVTPAGSLEETPMVEIECPEDPTWKNITVRYTSEEEIIELRLVSKASSAGDRYNMLRAADARCIAYLLLAATEHPTDGRISDEMPLITRRATTEQVELRLWGRKPVGCGSSS